MTTRYVGIGGNDANSGLTWALRKLTLNGAEDTPVVASDTVYVGPGTYRELLTADVSGTSGNPISYIADVDGTHTDGIGGPVRVTGSANDQVGSRANCFSLNTRNFRTIRGFCMDGSTSSAITGTGTDYIIEDNFFTMAEAGASISISGASQLRTTVRRNLFYMIASSAVFFSHTSTVSNAAHVIENNLVIGAALDGVGSTRVGGITVNNCSFHSLANIGVRIITALAVGQVVNVTNCLFTLCAGKALVATALGEIVEDYNNLYLSAATPRTNVNTGANSKAYLPMFAPQLMLQGKIFSLIQGEFASWSALGSIAGSSPSAEDLYGTTRAGTSSWGAVQYEASRRASDAGMSAVRRIGAK